MTMAHMGGNLKNKFKFGEVNMHNVQRFSGCLSQHGGWKPPCDARGN